MAIWQKWNYILGCIGTQVTMIPIIQKLFVRTFMPPTRPVFLEPQHRNQRIENPECWTVIFLAMDTGTFKKYHILGIESFLD